MSGEDPLLLLLSRIDGLCASALGKSTGPSSLPSTGVGGNNEQSASRIKQLEEDNFAVVQAKHVLETRLAKLEVESNSSTRNVVLLETKCTEIRLALDNAKQELSAALQKAQEFESLNKEAEDELRVTKRLLEQAEKQGEALQRKLDKANDEHASNINQVKQLEGENARLLSEQKARDSEAAKKLKALESELAQIQSGVLVSQGDATQALAQARQAQQAAESRCRELEAQLKAAAGEKKSLEEACSKLQGDLAYREEASKVLSGRIDKLEAQAKAAAAASEKQMTALREESASQQEQLRSDHTQALQTKDAEKLSERRKLEGLLAKATDDALAASAREEEAAEAAAARVAALQAECESLNSTIAELKALLLESSLPSASASPAVSASASAAPGAAVVGSAKQGSLPRQLLFNAPSNPILVVEMGAAVCRASFFDADSKKLQLLFSAPSYTASPRAGQTPESLVKSASFLCDERYAQFRREGLFVGEDARFFCYEHPDAGLRGRLQQDPPVIREGKITDARRFGALLQHCVSSGLRALAGGEEPANAGAAQILFAYKPAFDQADFAHVGSAAFGELGAEQLCLVSEASLVLSGQPRTSSCLLLDIGSDSSSVLPFYEGMVMRSAVQASALGGEHVTRALEWMLGKQMDGTLSSQLPRRRLDVARGVKESLAFVAEDYKAACAKYGAFARERVKVMGSASPSASASVSGAAGAEKNDLEVTHEVASKDASCSVTVSSERFHCAEILFNPSLLEQCADLQASAQSPSLVAAVIAAAGAIDESVRAEVCSTILLSGRTALVPGLAKRLQHELNAPLLALGVGSVAVITCEEASSLSPSAVWKGADARLRAAQAGERLEQQAFVSAGDFESRGAAAFDIVVDSF